MLALLLLVGFIGLIVSVSDWRKGAFISVAVGFLQDPIRKLVPGESVYLTLMVGTFVAATILGAVIQRGVLSFEPIHSWYGVLRIPLIAFVLLLTLQAAITTFALWKPHVGSDRNLFLSDSHHRCVACLLLSQES